MKKVEPTLSPDDLAEILDEAEPWPASIAALRDTTRSRFASYWTPEEAPVRRRAESPRDSRSYDYAHLSWLEFGAQTFELNAEILERYFELSSFVLDPGKEKVLFGVRGCELSAKGDRTTFSTSIRIREAKLDHVNFRCLIGVLDRSEGKIALFSASTVPEVTHMYAMIKGNSACNMQPTGRHEYRVGPHKGIKQPGAFRQQRDLLVRRSTLTLMYSPNEKGNLWDDLDGELPYNNIHAAAFNPSRSHPPFFSSAGCQVVKGWYLKDQVPTGPWAEFRVAAGLERRPIATPSGSTPEDGMAFEYVLCTGRELRALVSKSDADAKLRSLRFGSSGPSVAELQNALAKAAIKPRKAWTPGSFDRSTMEAVILWQRHYKPATGIVDVQDAAKLNLLW